MTNGGVLKVQTKTQSALPGVVPLVEREAKAADSLLNMLSACFGIGLFVALFAVFAYVGTFGLHLSHEHSVWNEAGGFFGGILGPTFSFLALLALLLTVALQREQLGLARTQLADSNAGLALSRSTYARQQFEGTFFELLKLTRELLDRFEVPEARFLSAYSTRADTPTTAPAKRGAAALDSYAASIHARAEDRGNVAMMDETDKARQLVRLYRADFYLTNPSAFGPYFRCLYQTFKHISESPLSDDEKKRFANIARGQISEGAVLLLALNGLTELGFNFIRYIEEFGLLEHMHRHYLARHKPALLMGYQDRAFMGGSERQDEPEVSTPKQRADFFVREVQEPIAAGGQPANPDLADPGSSL